MTDTDNEMEKQLAEMDRIEKLKGPRNPARHQQSFQPAPPTADEIAWQEAQAARQEAAKKPPVLPPRVEPDFVSQIRERLEREARHQRLKAARGGRLA